MFTRKGSIGLIIFYGLLMVLCWQTPAHAASIPPAIGDIVGTYVVTDKWVEYYFDEGVPIKGKDLLTWRITPLSDSTVSVYIEDWDWLFTAYYKNGYLVQSLHYPNYTSEYVVGVGIATFSGKPGKVKFKGDFGWGIHGGSEDYCDWDPFTGKMVSTDPDFDPEAALASQVDEQEVLEAKEEAVPLATTSPLGINDLPGTYSCTLTGTIYYPTAGGKAKEKDSDIMTITQTDYQTLNISTSEGDISAHCIVGVLMLSDVDDYVLDTNARFGILLAKGKPGKISLKGKVYSVRGLGAPEGDEFEVTKVSCKQTSP